MRRRKIATGGQLIAEKDAKRKMEKQIEQKSKHKNCEKIY
jgi:hypothetical protein